MDILSKLSERLKELMEEAGLNNSALAEKINFEQSEISKFLRAERMPSAATLVKLADFFNCTTDYILGLSDVLDDRKFKQRPPFSEQLNFLLKYFKVSKYRIEKDAGISEMAINRWQKGLYEPNIDSLIKLAKQFKCSVDFVLGREV